MEDNCQIDVQLKQVKDQIEQLEQIHNLRKAYIDGLCHGYLVCFVLCILIGICVYFVI